jgi:hypothetical protein
MFPRAFHVDVEQASGMNSSITAAEVDFALKGMANGKAAGEDGISAEFLTHDIPTNFIAAGHALLPYITHVFNVAFTNGEYPESWATCALTPVPKGKGDPTDPDSYRGIAVSNSLSKLFSTVLLNRLDAWAERCGKRAAGQAGFRNGHSTTDNVFVLQKCVEGSRPVYVAFIDFKKAYDCVNRLLLWRALEGMGVHGNMLFILQAMYEQVCMRVKSEGQLGDAFMCASGVKQGDPLSPLLFGLFIDRLEGHLAQQCAAYGVQLAQGSLLRALLYADDLVLLAQDREGLQALLDSLHVFAEVNHLTVNRAKSAVVVFNERNPGGAFEYGGEDLAVQDEYVYLGVTFSSKETKHIKHNLGARLGKAQAAYNCMQLRCLELDIHNVDLRCKLFDALVLSVLNFGCEIWGIYWLANLHTRTWQWGLLGKAELFHRQFLRWAFGNMPHSTPGMVLLHESARMPVVHKWVQQAVGWYNNIIKRRDTDVVRRALQASLSEGTAGSWGKAFLTLLRVINQQWGEAAVNMQRLDGVGILQELSSKLHAGWDVVAAEPAANLRLVEDTRSKGIKLLTFHRWFRSSQVAAGGGFYRHLMRPKHIRAMAEIRMSAHGLNIETLRHVRPRLPRDDRVCTCCDAGIREDELHIFECAHYADLRHRHGITPVSGNLDLYMQTIMNPGTEPERWIQLAEFLVAVLARRARTIDA